MEDRREFRFHDQKSGAAIHVRITPRAKKNEIVKICEDGVIKIRLTAPPEQGKANLALIEYLSKQIKVKRSDIEIIVGLSSKDKIVTIENIKSEELDKRIRELIDK